MVCLQLIWVIWAQDTPIARQDLAYMYTAKNRMDQVSSFCVNCCGCCIRWLTIRSQGIGLLLDLLGSAWRSQRHARYLHCRQWSAVGVRQDKPVPTGHGGAYGCLCAWINSEFFFVLEYNIDIYLFSCIVGFQGGVRSGELCSTLDILPTILDWTGVPFPKYSLNGEEVVLQGKSILPFLGGATGAKQKTTADVDSEERPTAPPPIPPNATRIYASHQFHEVRNRLFLLFFVCVWSNYILHVCHVRLT